MNTRSTVPPEAAQEDATEGRRHTLIATTLDCLAELGYSGTTLAQIAGRASVSQGLVAHYFGDKEGLLEAAFRSLASGIGVEARDRFVAARTARGRIQAIIDAYLGPKQFDLRTSRAWLAFWGQVPSENRMRRVQNIYQRRMLSHLRHALRQLLPAEQAVKLAALVAALIDGVWLRAALSNWAEANSEAARALVTQFVDDRLEQLAHAVPAKASAIGATSGTGTFTSVNPATGEVLATLNIAGAADIDAAVQRAVQAQKIWGAMTGAERGRILRRAVDLLRARNDELAALETRDTGKPIAETRVVDVVSGAECIEYFAGLAATLTGEHVDLGPAAFGYTRREPLGVVAGIGAWNYPLQIACWKSGPALACGNAMIFKPAELTPLTAMELEKVYLQAGVPPGVFQVVNGFAATGRLLSQNPAIRKLSLTGAVSTGKAVMADGASTLKQVTLELGGKSPLIVFDDASLDDAVSGAILGNFYSAGEVCSNATRVFVHESIAAEFIKRLLARTERMRIGDPMDPTTDVGALISEQHMHKVLSFIDRGRSQGARLLCGGSRRTDGAMARGWFVTPAVFDQCRDDMDIVRDEIFGPVMSVLTFRDEDEVIARANATEFGLAAGVFTKDLTRAHRVIAQLAAGTCWINHFNITPIELPFGGYKSSGIGRENSRAAIEHYTQIKSVYVAMQPVQSPY